MRFNNNFCSNTTVYYIIYERVNTIPSENLEAVRECNFFACLNLRYLYTRARQNRGGGKRQRLQIIIILCTMYSYRGYISIALTIRLIRQHVNREPIRTGPARHTFITIWSCGGGDLHSSEPSYPYTARMTHI